MLLGLLIRCIECYGRYISPLFPASCRFYPCCSRYATQTLRVHGYHGLYFVVRRILRCHPWHVGGVDLPPEKIKP